MHSLLALPIALLQIACTAQRRAPPADSRPSRTERLEELVRYDSAQPLDVGVHASFDRGDARVHDVTYASPRGGRVPAWLVEPRAVAGGTRNAGVVFGHWGGGDRTEFLAEAIALAPLGVVSILPDYPWERPNPWWLPDPSPSDPEACAHAYSQCVVDLSRAFDLLELREDVDRERIGYVGHSYGAQWGALLAACDRRMCTAVLVGGVPSAAALWLRTEKTPGFAAYVDGLGAGVVERFVDHVSVLDAERCVPHAAPIALFFQFGRHERILDEPAMAAFAAAASEPKSVAWYDTGHELLDARAIEDRRRWLENELALVHGATPCGRRP